MQAHAAANHGWLQYVLPLGIFVVIMSFRVRQMSQLRPLNPSRLWIVPGLYLVVCAVMIFENPPRLLGALACLAALAVGGALGWQRGKMMRIEVDPETHQIRQKASLAGILFLLAIVGIRAIARTEAGTLHLDIATLTDALAVFALGLFSATRLEMYLRATRLLAEARAARG